MFANINCLRVFWGNQGGVMFSEVKIEAGCHKCRKEGKSTDSVYTDIDALCDYHRKLEYDKKKCSICGKNIPANIIGWYVPNFGSYIDINYWCPDCIKKGNDAITKAKELLPKLKEDRDKLWDEQHKLFVSDKMESPIFEDEDGEFALLGEDYVTLRQFQQDIKYYKRHRNEIIANREQRDKLYAKYNEMKIKVDEAERVSNYYMLKANR